MISAYERISVQITPMIVDVWRIIKHASVSRGHRLKVEMSTLCSCARAIEDVVVAPRGKPIGKTLREGCANLILGIAV